MIYFVIVGSFVLLGFISHMGKRKSSKLIDLTSDQKTMYRVLAVANERPQKLIAIK